MTTLQTNISTATQGLSEADVVELLAAFNDTASRLQGVHETLRAEVARLKNELREANEQLQRSRRLAALGEMAAGIAHEVRNPLGSIRLYARLLEQDLTDRPPQRETAVKIASAVRGLDAVVSDVLAFAREMRVRPEPVDAEELLQRAVEEGLAGVPGAHEGVRVELIADAVGGGDGRELRCDAGLMHRALVNIVRNAAEAMMDADVERAVDRVLRVGIERVVVDDEHAPEHARAWDVIRVADTGPGIPPEVMERMFNPFFTTRHTGTGLGLAIVHRIVDAHGGRVEVRNVERDGRAAGAVVELALPSQTASLNSET